MKKQFIAKLLVLAMVLAMVPVTVLVASAAGTAGNNNDYNNYYYDYSIAADTVVTEDDIASGKLTVQSVGGVAIVPLDDDAVASLVKNGVLTLEVTFDENTTRAAFTFTAASVAEAGVKIQTNLGTIDISAEKLAKLIGDAENVMIVLEVREDAVWVVVYADWVAVYEEPIA